MLFIVVNAFNFLRLPMIIKIRNRLRLYREKRGLSQEDLAQMCQITKETISRIERNKVKLPHPKTRQKIAKALDVEIFKIFIPIEFKPQ